MGNVKRFVVLFVSIYDLDDSNADHVKEKARAFVRKSMEEKK